MFALGYGNYPTKLATYCMIETKLPVLSQRVLLRPHSLIRAILRTGIGIHVLRIETICYCIAAAY